MTKTLHGKVHGKTIELDEDLGVAEGQEVEVQVRIVQPARKWGEGILRTAGARRRSRMGYDHGADSPRTERRHAMTKVLHGIVHGKIIEVTEDLGMLDGQAVELIVTAAPPSGPCAEGTGSENHPRSRRDHHPDGSQVPGERPRGCWRIRGRRRMIVFWKRSIGTASEKLGVRSLNELSTGYQHPFRSLAPPLGLGPPLLPVFRPIVYNERRLGRIVRLGVQPP